MKTPAVLVICLLLITPAIAQQAIITAEPALISADHRENTINELNNTLNSLISQYDDPEIIGILNQSLTDLAQARTALNQGNTQLTDSIITNVTSNINQIRLITSYPLINNLALLGALTLLAVLLVILYLRMKELRRMKKQLRKK